MDNIGNTEHALTFAALRVHYYTGRSCLISGEGRNKVFGYSFTTLAVSAMKSAVNTERRKQNRRPQTISLDAPYKGTYGKPLIEYIAA